MADNFFGFNTTFEGSSLDDGLDDCLLDDDEYGEEEKYDALNDETFGSEATIGDWEQDHEKLAELTESTRPQHQNQNSTTINNEPFLQQNGPDHLDIDVEDNLSHLVLDEKDGITSRPGVWDSPTLSSLASPRPTPLPKPSLASTLKNACTVEEIERNLIAKRNDLFYQQQHHQQHQQNAGRQTPNHVQQQLPLNGLPPPQRFPPPTGLPPHSANLPPNVRLPHAPFLPKFCLPPNQSGNMIRYPLPPHLMMAHAQRQQFHNNFPMGNFHNLKQQQNKANMVNLPFIRPDRTMLPFFANNMPGHQHPPHPNFGMNQRNNNQNRHPNDMPFFKNNLPYHNRGYNHHKDINGMNHHHNFGDKYDEYAGLMSNREKQWLVNIQLLQLNTNQPYIDDYYYTVFSDRQNKKNENKNKLDKKQQNNNGYHKDSRDRDQPTFTRSPYTPTQFENSLGKLQYSSVTAPRKIIDMDIVSNNEKQEALPPQPKDTKKTRQMLLEIERLYILQLKLEDINNPLALLSEQQQQQAQQQQQQQDGGEVEPKEPKKTVPELCNMMLMSLLQLIKDDKFISMLSIRKGKTLLLRFLPFLSVTEYTNQLQELWSNLLRGLAIIGRRDSNLLMNFYSEFRRWLQTTEHFSTLISLARAFTESSNMPSKSNSLSFAVTNKFGVSVLASMLEQAEELYPSDDEQRQEWSQFINSMVDVCGNKVPIVAPCEPIAANTLNQHLSRIHGLTMDRFEPLENLLTDANPAR